MKYRPLPADSPFPTYAQADHLTSELINAGKPNPSAMAKKKFYAHRPKPANNVAKNRARRARVLLETSCRSNEGRGNKPEPAQVFNAQQVRNLARAGMADQRTLRAWRAICRDQSGGRTNHNWYNGAGGGDRECARRRKQMEKAHG